MIYLSAHKDFDLNSILKNETIYKLQNELSIIDGNELINEYPINIIHETLLNNDLFLCHNLWGELTRMYYIYKNFNLYNSDIVGFIQYKRTFIDETLINHKDILNEYDLICPKIEIQYGMYNKFHHYSDSLMELCFQLLYTFYPSYRQSIDLLYENPNMICHNMFIMRKNDFIECCNFIFYILKLLNKVVNIVEYQFTYIKPYSLIAERLFHLFYLHHFNQNKIYYSDIINL